MTHEMLAKARDNVRRIGLGNVEFRLGELEHLPIADNTADAGDSDFDVIDIAATAGA